jgi:type II secretory pathway predicted ATPase ExeA
MSTDTSWTSKRADGAVALHAQTRPGWLTYETFYGLTGKPFSLCSDPAFFYNSSSHAAAFDDLLSGIRRRESLSVLSGDIGTGKTTLCRTVLEKLDRQTFSAFVADPFATREDLLKVVLVEFGIVSAEDLATGRLRGASRTELSYLLYEFLGTLLPLQAFAVVFIDEAQNLSLPLLEEIRILSDSDGRERQLQVVLVGQLELRDKLRLPEMRQVAQRVSVCCGLEPLDREGVDGYIAHRLHVAGGTPDRIRFSRAANDAIYDASRGVPRLINRLCDRSLHHGHLARASVIDAATFALAYEEMKPLLPAQPTGSRVVVLSPDADPFAGFPSEHVAPRENVVASTALTVARTDGADAWFAETDARVSEAVETDSVPMRPVEDGRVTPLWAAEHRSRTTVPLTHTEMQPRVWLRRLEMAVLLLAIVAGTGLGLVQALRILSEPVIPPSIESPAPPALPMAFVIPDVPADDQQLSEDMHAAPATPIDPPQ